MAAAVCDATPVLEVDGIAYGAGEVGALGAGELKHLATLTAFGLAVAHDSLAAALAPFLHAREQRLLLQQLAATVEVHEAGLSEADLRRIYRRDPEYRLTIRHLVVLAPPYALEEKKREARERATAALRRIRGGESFAKVAAQVSEEPGAERSGGLLDPGVRGSWVEPFWNAASKLSVGEVSDVVQTRYGYHVLKLEDRQVIPFDSVRSRVLTRVASGSGRPEAAREWATRQVAALVVDTAAIERLRAAPDSADAGTPLGHWPGGTYSVGEFREYLLTLSADAAARLASAERSQYVDVVAAAASNALLAARAREMGVEVDAKAIAAETASQVDAARSWAEALGFRRGDGAAAIRAAALRAIGGTSQATRLARAAVDSVGGALRRLYPVREGAGSGATDGGTGGL